MNTKTIRYFEQFLVQANFKDIFKLQWKNRWLCNECVNRNEYFFLISTAFLPLNIFILLPFFLYSNFFFYFYFSVEIFLQSSFFLFLSPLLHVEVSPVLHSIIFSPSFDTFFLLTTSSIYWNQSSNTFSSAGKDQNFSIFCSFFCVKNEFSTKFYLLYLKYMRMKEYKLGGSQSETEAPEIIE